MSQYTKPNWKNSILITIDTQNDFSLFGSPSEIPGTVEIIPSMKNVIESYRKAKLPIIHVIRLYKTDGSNVDISRKKLIESGFHIVTPNSYGADLVNDIKLNKNQKLDTELLLNGGFQQLNEHEWIMYKPRWGAFYQTDLEDFLINMNIDTLIFSGVNFPNCPRTSMYEASERDFRVVMISDAMSGLYEKGIEEMDGIGISVLKSNEVIQHLKNNQNN